MTDETIEFNDVVERVKAALRVRRQFDRRNDATNRDRR